MGRQDSFLQATLSWVLLRIPTLGLWNATSWTIETGCDTETVGASRSDQGTSEWHAIATRVEISCASSDLILINPTVCL